MKKVLIVTTKNDTIVFDISKDTTEIIAYQKIFNLFEEECFYEEDMDEIFLLRWYKEIKKGDFTNLKKFIKYRSDHNYEYENVKEYEVQ